MKHQDAQDLWEEIYRAASPKTSGKPGTALRQFADTLAPGRALDLGCGKGDDAVWLAGKGWNVVAVDISQTALGYAAANAERAGVLDRITFERHDLERSFPTETFDLVTASFLHSMVEWARSEVLRRGAEAVAPGGHFLAIEHASRAPWSWAAEDTVYPTADETLASLTLKESDWTARHVAAIERLAKGPDGQTAMVRDNVIVLKRR